MWKNLILAGLLGTVITGWGQKVASADTVLENVARSGVLTVGTSFDLVPYAYYNPEGELVGYSVDLINLIKEELEAELSRSIEVRFVEASNIREAIPKMMTGEIDISCNKVFTWQRDKYVDYTIRYSVSGIRLLVPKGSMSNSSDDLRGKKIGVPPLTFVEDAMELAHPNATLVEFSTVQESAMALKEGKVDALAGDTVILDGIRQEINPDGLEQFPPLSEDPYARYGVGCIVPQNNSAFLHIADRTIAKMMEGYIIGDPEYKAMMDKWLGEGGITSVVNHEDIKMFFESIIILHEQIPPDEL